MLSSRRCAGTERGLCPPGAAYGQGSVLPTLLSCLGRAKQSPLGCVLTGQELLGATQELWEDAGGGQGVSLLLCFTWLGWGESVSSGNMDLENSAQSVEVDLYFCFSLEQLMWGSHAGGLWGGSAAQAVLGLLSFCLQRRFLALC